MPAAARNPLGGGATHRGAFLAFVVNSSPGPGLRAESSASFPDAKTALDHVKRLAVRGMQLIKVRETASGEVYDEAGLRLYIAKAEGVRFKE